METPIKILILTADAGFGHRAAANAIAKALQERYGDACSAIIVNPLEDRRAPALLRRAQDDYDKLVKEAPELYKFGYKASDGSLPISLAEQALIAMLYLTMRDLLQEQRPAAIITTYPLYQAPLAAIFALSDSYLPMLTVVTDLVTVHGLWFNDDVDKCLVPTQPVLKKALESGMASARLEVTGLPVNPALARPVQQAELRQELGWSQERCAILMVGGTRVKKLEPVAHVLNHSGLPLELILVAGGDKALHERWQATEWHLPAHVHGLVPDLTPLIQAADMIACKAGGLIVSEGLAAGKPLLLVEAIPGQETGNAEYVVKGGAGALVQDPAEALTEVFHWLDKARAGLKERAGRAQRLGVPDAAYRIADLAWEAAQQGASRGKRKFGEQLPLLERILSGLDLA